MKNVAIEVTNLVKRYKKAESNAVDDISFAVKRGEFFALLGPNGAGKTTTISILSTTLAKTSGVLRVAGFDIDEDPSSVRRSVGVIFQKPSLDLNLTAEENVRFHAILYGLFPYRPTYFFMDKSYKEKLQELAEVLGIEDKMFQPVKTFSGGMKRKLEIVRSLIHEPKVLFLDEPTSGLDPVARRKLWDYLTSVMKKHEMTVFLTTHYLEEAESADHVVVINTGKVAFDGTVSGLKKKLVKRYVICDAKDREKLKKEIKKMKLEYIENTDSLKIDIEDRPAQKVIQSIKSELTYLDIHNPSLEDAYLDLIGPSTRGFAEVKP